jgi:hypothetical protein
VRLSPIRNLANPDSQVVDLGWQDELITYIPGAKAWGSIVYRGNSCFDPQFSLGGQSAYNFSFYAGMYRRYTVIGIRVTATFANLEAFPIIVNAAPSTLDLTTSIVSPSSALDLGEFPWSIKNWTMAAKGGQDRVSYTHNINWGTFIGTKARYMDSINYSSLVNSNPSSAMFYVVSFAASASMETGILVSVNISFRTLFSERNPNVTGLFTHHHPTNVRRDAKEFINC